ncbi:MAG: hypothetical protein NT007_00095 [Candidatus Kapabacteria bacterium]|nr:hypothetical protein [Candidatus Kapabacteria bacterium]
MNFEEFKDKIFGRNTKALKHLEKLLNSKNSKGNLHFSVNILQNSLILDANYQDWLSVKIKDLKKADLTGISSILGEIRALSYLNKAFGNIVEPKNETGPDFEIKSENQKIVVEVNTQLGSQKANILIDHGEFISKNFEMKILEHFPYSFPDRKRDNITGNATSKVAQIKGDEHQFRDEDINILWIDYLDPIAWTFDLSHHTQPIGIFNESFTSGFIWWAIYGKKEDKIFDNLNIEFGIDKPYIMEFDGKFSTNSKIDFIVFIFELNTIVFQNYQRKNPDDSIFLGLFQLPFYNYQESWINFPIINLLDRIISKKLEIEKLVDKINGNKNAN